MDERGEREEEEGDAMVVFTPRRTNVLPVFGLPLFGSSVSFAVTLFPVLF